MGYVTHIDIERIKAKHYNPSNPASRLAYKDPDVCLRFDFGIVDNNADPDNRGRLKVRFPHWGDVITNWIPMVRPYASREVGIWILPDVGTQVICAFFNDCASRPIVIGSVYTPRALPPIEDNEENNLKVLTTRSGSQIILDDTDGEEKILVHTKDGTMRLVLDKAKGLSIVNENGDISIKCRKLIVESADDAYITINKDFSITAKQTITNKAKRSVSIKSGKDVVFKAKSKINIKGNTGVTAGVQQIAKEDDQVVGVDLHDIKVPTNSGLKTIPMIPHPYMGKLADKLSQDVMINDKPAATKGSKSKFDTPGHICMPPGVKFKKNPNNEGEVSSGTVSNVKINGKDAAVLGSMVKTCNDPQPQETCSIIAVGAPVILPIVMPGMDEEQFKKDGGTRFNTSSPVTTLEKTTQVRKQPKLQNPEWSTGSAIVGETVTLSAQITDLYEGANVTFTIWEKEADREKDMPVNVYKGQNKGGKAEVEWHISLNLPEKLDDGEPEIPPFDEISGIQSRLNRLNFFCGKADGVLGEKTKQAVKNFQKNNGLKSDGIPGIKTQTKLEEKYCKTIDMSKQEKLKEFEQEFIFDVKAFRCKEVISGSFKVTISYIEIRLIGDNDEPIPYEEYEIAKENGAIIRGRLDGRGYALVVAKGECKIRFINIDDGAWEKK